MRIAARGKKLAAKKSVELEDEPSSRAKLMMRTKKHVTYPGVRAAGTLV